MAAMPYAGAWAMFAAGWGVRVSGGKGPDRHKCEGRSRQRKEGASVRGGS